MSLLGCHSWWALPALFLWVACGCPGKPRILPPKAEALCGGQKKSSQALANFHVRPLSIPSEGALLWGLSLTVAFLGQTCVPRFSRLCSGVSTVQPGLGSAGCSMTYGAGAMPRTQARWTQVDTHSTLTWTAPPGADTGIWHKGVA